MKIRTFIKTHFRHFNAATVADAAEAYVQQIASGNKMFLTMAGAMSAGALGTSLAEMIRKDKVHAISCTAANLETDLFRLLSSESDTHTDTTQLVETIFARHWQAAAKEGQRFFPHEYFYQVLRSGDAVSRATTNPQHSWLLAACEKDLPLYVPGWEDSITGRGLVAMIKRGMIRDHGIIKTGLEYMDHLSDFYQGTVRANKMGFFQIGGGIAGDFPLNVVSLLKKNLRQQTQAWSYFCQISDSTASYGSYSGATPPEKITEGTLGADIPWYIIESDASIVAPLLFGYILDL